MAGYERQPDVSWENAGAMLRRWHSTRERQVGRAVFGFIETELRLMIPPSFRRSWGEDRVEDVLRDFLKKLVKRPLPEHLDNLRSYLSSGIRRQCIDAYRKDNRRPEEPIEDDAMDEDSRDSGLSSPLQLTLRNEQHAKVHAALVRLEVADRVALKLEHGPEWLDEAEIAWLGARAALDTVRVRAAIAAAATTYDLTQIFDPEADDPADPEAHRKRMERFRRRRSRALEKLKAFLEEVEP